MIHHSFDEYEAPRVSHYPRGSVSHRGLPSPPSFYAAPPPPPPPSAPSSGLDHRHHQVPHHHHQSHQNQHGSSANYYPSAPHQYMTHYPPPPPPPKMNHNMAMEDHDRQGMHSKHDGGYLEQTPFSPFEYQRHYTYSHAPPLPSGYGTNGFSKVGASPTFANGSSKYDAFRGAGKVNGTRKSISEGHGMTLGDQAPTYIGHIKSANDAILLLSACDLLSNPSLPSENKSREDTLPPPRRVTRRLLDAERADLVASGSVFVWDEKEAGMKRWTDGRVWSASRVSGCFLTYRELEARKKISTSSAMADGPSSNQYKPDGLIKQSFSITTSSGRKLHVISYFTKRDIREGRFRRVSEDPRFVGEGGGEWGLAVDEKEYSFPDMQQIIRTAGQGGSEGSVNGNLAGALERGDDEASDLSEPSEARSPSLRLDPAVVEEKFENTMKLGGSEVTRKRSIPEDIDTPANASSRPRLTRLRSSSMSGVPTFTFDRQAKNDQSDSNPSSSGHTSLATTLPSESDSTHMRGVKAGYNKRTLNAPTGANRSTAIRALVSPTLPRESALRDSACEMKPTQSQDCANAVGALLSLAGNSSKSLLGEVKKSPKASSPLASNSTPSSPTTIAGLGLSVKALPKRRDSDRAALNKFSIRL
ncbi:hypothetical protein CBS101457_004438 [Exobasidium rhododendri]|nr:hypothetical protein CBS101457_004438 [Exobasidium rhododendri]